MRKTFIIKIEIISSPGFRDTYDVICIKTFLSSSDCSLLFRFVIKPWILINANFICVRSLFTFVFVTLSYDCGI